MSREKDQLSSKLRKLEFHLISQQNAKSACKTGNTRRNLRIDAPTSATPSSCLIDGQPPSATPVADGRLQDAEAEVASLRARLDAEMKVNAELREQLDSDIVKLGLPGGQKILKEHKALKEEASESQDKLTALQKRLSECEEMLSETSAEANAIVDEAERRITEMAAKMQELKAERDLLLEVNKSMEADQHKLLELVSDRLVVHERDASDQLAANISEGDDAGELRACSEQGCNSDSPCATDGENGVSAATVSELEHQVQQLLAMQASQLRPSEDVHHQHHQQHEHWRAQQEQHSIFDMEKNASISNQIDDLTRLLQAASPSAASSKEYPHPTASSSAPTNAFDASSQIRDIEMQLAHFQALKAQQEEEVRKLEELQTARGDLQHAVFDTAKMRRMLQSLQDDPPRLHG